MFCTAFEPAVLGFLPKGIQARTPIFFHPLVPLHRSQMTSRLPKLIVFDLE